MLTYDINLGGVKELLKETEWLLERYKYLQTKILLVGIDTTRGSDLWFKGMANEYGQDQRVTPAMRLYLHQQGFHLSKNTEFLHTPQRSFIMEPMEDNEKMVFDWLHKYTADHSVDKDQILERLGVDIVDFLKEYMIQLNSPKNHWFTLKEKRGTSPLIDTGELMDALTYSVEDDSIVRG